MTQEKNLTLGQKQPCQTVVLIITHPSGEGGEFSKHTEGWGCNSARKPLSCFFKTEEHCVFPSKSHRVVPGMLCLQVQFPWRSPPWTRWIYSHGQPWIAGLFQSFRELCTTPECPFLGRNWNLGHLNALQSITHKLPPNPTSCVFPKDATAKGCAAPWGSSPPREEQGRADLAF